MYEELTRNTEIENFNLTEIAKDLYKLHTVSTIRGLNQSAKWAAEMLYALPPEHVSQKKFLEDEELVSLTHFPEGEWVGYNLSKSYFTLQEYDRAAFFTREATHPVIHFFHLYSTYLSAEKRKLDNSIDSITPIQFHKDEKLLQLRVQLDKKYREKTLDGFLLYLYGVVLKKLHLHSLAVEILCEALEAEPLQWSAWQELTSLVTNYEMLKGLKLPNHWLRHLFTAGVYLEFQYNDEALNLYRQLQGAGLHNSTYIKSQVAIAYHNMREVDQAIESFKALLEEDPYRLDKMDIYSNLLYVKEMRVELSQLAYSTCETDKYRVETCCIIGNFYSLRSQHEKAVIYFQKALKLNPNYLSAWTLMGHEFMEMKNTPAAVQAYRQAIDVNQRDYRAWYGLGQTYEIIKMPYYSLNYYKRAQQLRPNDSRMMVALGEAYEKLDKLQEAKTCFWRAQAMGDIEQTALLKLAKLYDRLGDKEMASLAYIDYLRVTDQKRYVDKAERANTYKYLANYYLSQGKTEEAYEYAHKCLGYPETREEGKTLIKQMALKKDNTAMDISQTSRSIDDITMEMQSSTLDITF